MVWWREVTVGTFVDARAAAGAREVPQIRENTGTLGFPVRDEERDVEFLMAALSAILSGTFNTLSVVYSAKTRTFLESYLYKEEEEEEEESLPAARTPTAGT
ncbi:hypothetical protein BHE74_00014542 [Ensete ventricosum]|nr:hypothetical protein GW17_00047579 [Ensete ventricosum]RWW77306.1 hypothetical protein BHE74_00014542 [Ensete ventricosum]